MNEYQPITFEQIQSHPGLTNKLNRNTMLPSDLDQWVSEVHGVFHRQDFALQDIIKGLRAQANENAKLKHREKIRDQVRQRQLQQSRNAIAHEESMDVSTEDPIDQPANQSRSINLAELDEETRRAILSIVNRN